MVNIRGVNVYPAGIESVVRHIAEVVEFRSTVSRRGELRSLTLEIEVAPQAAEPSAVAQRVAAELKEAIGLTVPVRVVVPGTLPRFEMKSSRFVVEA
jgi:phenylacetate-CoA ligase